MSKSGFGKKWSLLPFAVVGQNSAKVLQYGLRLSDQVVPWEPTTVFAYFTTIVSFFLTDAIFDCHLHGHASFDEKK